MYQDVLAVADNSYTGIPDFVSENMKVVTGIICVSEDSDALHVAAYIMSSRIYYFHISTMEQRSLVV